MARISLFTLPSCVQRTLGGPVVVPEEVRKIVMTAKFVAKVWDMLETPEHWPYIRWNDSMYCFIRIYWRSVVFVDSVSSCVPLIHLSPRLRIMLFSTVSKTRGTI